MNRKKEPNMPQIVVAKKRKKLLVPKEKVIMRAYSERQSWLTCRQQWDWAFNDWLVPKTTNRHLKFGDLTHQALALYYKPGIKRGPHPAVSFAKIYDEVVDESFSMKREGDEWLDAKELGVHMLENYIEHWGDDSHIKVLAPESHFEVDLWDDDGVYVCTAVGSFDVLFMDLNLKKIGILETKTAAAISKSHLPLDEQAGTYWAFASLFLSQLGMLKPGRDISFILYNFLRKAMKDERPKNDAGHSLNKNGTVSKKQPSPIFDRQPVYRGEVDKNYIIKRTIQQAKEMALARKGELAIYKNPRGTYPDQHCMGCGFKDMCELHETGSNWEEYREAVMDRANPNANYEQRGIDG